VKSALSNLTPTCSKEMKQLSYPHTRAIQKGSKIGKGISPLQDFLDALGGMGQHWLEGNAGSEVAVVVEL